MTFALVRSALRSRTAAFTRSAAAAAAIPSISAVRHFSSTFASRSTESTATATEVDSLDSIRQDFLTYYNPSSAPATTTTTTVTATTTETATVSSNSGIFKPDRPYVVRRTKQGLLPVYTNLRNGGSRVLTTIKRIEGDVDLFVQELVATKPHLATLIVKYKFNIITIKGNHRENIKQWLAEKDF